MLPLWRCRRPPLAPFTPRPRGGLAGVVRHITHDYFAALLFPVPSQKEKQNKKRTEAGVHLD